MQAGGQSTAPANDPRQTGTAGTVVCANILTEKEKRSTLRMFNPFLIPSRRLYSRSFL
jgi:hypothetical protein